LGVDASVYADIDGPGGDGPLLVAAGFGGVYVLRNSAWEKIGIGGPSSMPTNALTMWDQDGDGPLPPRLSAGGNFIFTGISRIPMWTGTS